MQKLSIKEIAKPALVLFAVCLVVAAALAAVKLLAEEPIAASELRLGNQAQQLIFPGAEFEDMGGYHAAYLSGALLGWCVDTQAQGYGGPVKITTGIDPEGRVVMVQVTSAEGETPGLGTKIREESFLRKFIGGSDYVAVDSIASATYSSQAVVEAVNEALAFYREVIAI